MNARRDSTWLLDLACGLAWLCLCAAPGPRAWSGEAEPPAPPPEKTPAEQKEPQPKPAAPGAQKADEPAPGEEVGPPLPPPPKPDPGPPPPDSETPRPPAAETVELPEPVTPVVTPGVAIGPAARPPQPEQEDFAVQALREEWSPGEEAAFTLRGPEEFLAGASAQYVLADEAGRECARGGFKLAQVKLENGARAFNVPLTRVLGGFCMLSVGLVGADDKRLERSALFRVKVERPWTGWVGLLHAPYPRGHWEALRALGVRGGMAYRLHPGRREALRAAEGPFFVENVARQFLSRYQAERGLWEQVCAAAAADPAGLAPLVRTPSLSAPDFSAGYAKELERHAAAYKDARPIFYSLASEPSVTRLAAAFDFDYHAEALKEFRRWLERDVYGTLSALNESWGTAFTKWDEVLPMTTPEAQRRLRDGSVNFAPWVDFRAFQDHAFARALEQGRTGLKAGDPAAKSGITGALGAFAFGGWDWSRLAGALDVCEAYDIGAARALWRSLAPGKPALAMLPLEDNPARLKESARVLWELALEGGPRGALLWDEAPAAPAPAGAHGPQPAPGGGTRRILLDAEGRPTPAAEALAPALRALDGPLGRLLSQARREPGGVALLYSPASVRVHWLLEAERLHGEAWLKAWGADSAAERRESPQLRLRESWMKLLADLGLPWRFVSSAEVEQGALASKDELFRAVVLPRALALSDREVEALLNFAAQGGTVVMDAVCGRFDAHGRGRAKPPFDGPLGVDTAREPLCPEAERPLEPFREAAPPGQAGGWPAADELALPPAHSGEPQWTGAPPARRWEYRKSPALVRKEHGKGALVYLNLKLDDYLRWRLHPKRARARNTREALARVAFLPLLDALSEDLAASTLPAGTEIVRLRLGAAPDAPRLLALRRNAQARLHELGHEEDDNACFENSEPFKLVLRAPRWAAPLSAAGVSAATSVLEGTLDPVTPALFALRTAAAAPPALAAPAELKRGETLVLKIGAPGRGAALYELRVKGPNGAERASYAGLYWSPDGLCETAFPLALNDPPGEWTLAVRDVMAGLEAAATVKVLAGE